MKGIVIKSTGSWYSVLSENGEKVECRIKGIFRMKGIKTTNPIAVGDRVIFSPEPKESTGIINEIEKRKNYIIRKSINLSKQSHIIAANIDQAFLMVTLIHPKTSMGFIDRFLITAEAYYIPVHILINKTDIYGAKEKEEMKDLIGNYQRIGYNIYPVSVLDKNDLIFLKEKMKDKINLVSGHSGVGKSTLINTLQPGANLKVNEISAAHNKGTHSTTFAEMHELSFGGFIIDTPGIKELGIVDMKKEELSHCFPEMRALLNKCKYDNCTHLNEPHCAVIEAVENGGIALSRYNSYVGILEGKELEKKYSD